MSFVLVAAKWLFSEQMLCRVRNLESVSVIYNYVHPDYITRGGNLVMLILKRGLLGVSQLRCCSHQLLWLTVDLKQQMQIVTQICSSHFALVQLRVCVYIYIYIYICKFITSDM